MLDINNGAVSALEFIPLLADVIGFPLPGDIDGRRMESTSAMQMSRMLAKRSCKSSPVSAGKLIL